MPDYQSQQLKEKVEVLDGSRSGERKAAAVRIGDLQALIDYNPRLKSVKAAGATPTKAEFDALVTDVLALHAALKALAASLQGRL
jgi:hypothetical protein